MYVIIYQTFFWSGQRRTDFEENQLVINLVSLAQQTNKSELMLGSIVGG